MAQRIVVNQSAINRMVSDPNSPVFRNTFRRGKRVEGYMKRYAPVDTGRLRASITTEMVLKSGKYVARIGPRVNYTPWVTGGTGIYGPRRRPIRPKRPGGVLVFKPKGSSRIVFAREVRGQKPNDFMIRALRDGMKG